MTDNRIRMKNVRLSFPNLFQTSVFGGKDTLKYDATFILDKDEHADTIKEIQAGMQALADEKFKGKLPPFDKLCLKDGDDSVHEEDIGKFKIKASTKKRPLVLNRDKTPVTEDDNVFYAGCYVNSIISLWAQDNQFGKRINASLDGVMFCGHGEPFGAPAIDADEFDAFGDNEYVDEAVGF